MLRQPPLPQRMVQERRDFLRVGLGRVPGTVGDIGFKIFFIDGRKFPSSSGPVTWGRGTWAAGDSFSVSSGEGKVSSCGITTAGGDSSWGSSEEGRGQAPRKRPEKEMKTVSVMAAAAKRREAS